MSFTAGVIQVPPDSTGKMMDTDTGTRGANTVHRAVQRIGGSAAAGIAEVSATPPGSAIYGLAVREVGPNTGGTVTQSTIGTTASVNVIAANANRMGLVVLNTNASNTLFGAYGQTPTTSAYTIRIPPATSWEMPFDYLGAFSFIADAAGTVMNWQELT